MIKSIWVRLVIALAVCFALTACGSTQIRVVEKHTYVVAEVDPVYLNDCEQTDPPKPADFIAMSDDQRIDVLTRTLSSQYKNTLACSSDKKSIRELIDKQKKAVAERNAAEEARIKTAEGEKQ